MSGGRMSGGRMSGGRMSGGRLSGGRMSGGRLFSGLKSYDHCDDAYCNHASCITNSFCELLCRSTTVESG